MLKITLAGIFFYLLLASPHKLFAQTSPFLYLPFSSKTEFSITEGWFYSEEEKKIHGFSNHYAIDYALAEGTPIYAAASGYAITFSEFSYLDRTYQGKQVGYALGNTVQIWHPEVGLFTEYAHLSEVERSIPQVTYSNVRENGRFINRGDLIGWAGDSGLSWGYQENSTYRPNRIDYPSWDEIHLHFEVFSREKNGNKYQRLDPYDIYSKREAYQNLRSSEKVLWVLDENGKPRFAKNE